MARPNRARTIGSEANLAKRIAHERSVRGWSYDTLAKRMTDAGCAIQGSALYKVERGEPRRRITVDELTALSQVFDVEIENLLTPMEAVRQERAKKLIARLEPAARTVLEGVEEMLRLWVEFYELAVDDWELHEYIANHWFGGYDEDGDGDGRTLKAQIELAPDAPLLDVDVPAFDAEPFNKALATFLATIITTAGEIASASVTDEEGGK